MDIFDTYSNITHTDAQTRLQQRFKDGTFPPLDDIKSRRAFDLDDHWQEGGGFIGQLPTGDSAGGSGCRVNWIEILDDLHEVVRSSATS